MADIKIIDETKDEAVQLSEEELKELLRQENLKKLTKKRKPVPNVFSIFVKIIMIASLITMILSMATSSGVLLATSMIVLIISSAVSDLFYKDK